MILSSIINLKSTENSVLSIPISKITPNKFQPRRFFDNEELTSLAKSISQHGILQPLTVRQIGDQFEIVCGERRLRAAKILGLSHVPCTLCDISDSNSALAALVENLQRKDLNFFEQAEGFQLLINEFSMSQSQISLALGFSQPAISNKLRLLKLNENQRKIILKNSLCERHARALLRVDENKRDKILTTVCENNLTAEAMEKYIDDIFEKEKVKASYKKRAAALSDVRLFFNTVEKAVNVMRLAGVEAQTERKETDGYIEYLIKIPDKKARCNVPRGTNHK